MKPMHHHRYAVTVGIMAFCLATTNSHLPAQEKDSRAGILEFDQVKKLISDALREKDIDVDAPVLLTNTHSKGKFTEYAYPDRLLSLESFGKIPHREAFEA